MNFDRPKIEKNNLNTPEDEKNLEDLRIIAGYGIKVSLQDQSYDSESDTFSEGFLEGALDADINFGKPIYLDNGKKHTELLRKIIRKKGKTLIITDDTVYWLRIIPPEE